MTIHDFRLKCASIILRLFGWKVHNAVQAIHFCGFKNWILGLKRIRNYSKECSKTSTFKHELAVCAIMKDEGPYLKEWLDYHILVGVQHFYLYDNGCTDDTDDILKSYIEAKVATLIRFPGERMQKNAYNDCIARFYNEAKWIAVIDLDEFIVPCTADSITEILKNVDNDCDQISLDWIIFGSSGLQKYEPRPVIERFTRRGTKFWLEKSIVNPRHVYGMDVHCHFVLGKTIRLPNNILRVNHYHCKSWEEYLKKSSRGDAYYGQSGGTKYQRSCFDGHDLNDVEDLSAARFAPKLPRPC